MKLFGVRLAASRQLVMAAAALITVFVIVAGQLAGMDVSHGLLGLVVAIAVPFTILGVLVLMSVPRHAVGRMMSAAGLIATVSLVGLTWSRFVPLAWLGQWSWVASFGLIFLAVLLFPDGHLPSPRWRLVAVVIIIGTAVGVVGLASALIIEPALLIKQPMPVHPTAQLLARIGLFGALAAVVGFLGVLVSLGVRWRRADTGTRRQLMCLLPACILVLVGLTLQWYSVDGAWALTASALPLGMTVAILRYRLYDVDLIINRTIVWFLMTALIVIGFVAIVKILSDVAVGRILSDVVLPFGENSPSLLATGLIAVTFEPLHRRVQRAVNRMLYGDRDDPYLVVARLGEVLGRTVDPTAIMPLLTRTIAHSLQVPYVAVELQERDGPVLVTEHGRPVPNTESFEMVSHGEQIGRLLVGWRSTGDRFSPHECRLLRNVALQAAVAAEATRLNRDLQMSRERLVMAREEERRRLRRDLHDGLGPSLAGMSMQVRAALRLLPPDGRAAQILTALITDLSSCTTEVRQLVDELRPPGLDRGLEAALRGECRRFATAGLSVTCHVAGCLKSLPAAVEVAAFRIVAEALTNVARHSRAHNCHVTLHCDDVLRVSVVDDGIGITSSARAGVGLHSMRERAAELGGDCTIGPVPSGGTAVQLELPLAQTRRTTHNSDSTNEQRG